MSNAVHPGQILKHDCIEATGMKVVEAARLLGVPRAALSRVLNCKAVISPQIAIRLEEHSAV